MPPGQEIAGEYRAELGDLVIVIVQQGRGYLVTVEGLESEQAAQQYVNTLWAGLMWVLLNKKLAVQAELQLQNVTWRPENSDKFMSIPVKDDIQGVIEGNFPVVYPTDTRLIRLEMPPARVSISTPVSDVCQILLDGVSFPQSARVIADSKLKLALELYRAYWTEASPNARFLTLVMALEVLALGYSQAKRKQDAIHRFVKDTLGGDQSAIAAARQAKKIYEKRNTLVHEGQLPESELASLTNNAFAIVESVLKAKFRLAACSES